MTRQRRALMAAGAAIAAAAGSYLLWRRFSERAEVTPAGVSPVAPAIDSTDGGESREAAGTATS
jgi:hypothetical protein